MLSKILIGIVIGIFSLLAIPKTPNGIKIEDLKKEAALNNKKAQYKLALCYYRGEYIEKDEVLAMYHLTMSASQTYNKAQYALGLFFGQRKDLEGNVSEDDINYALYWLNKAAKNEHIRAKLVLEEMGKEVSNFEFTEDDFKRR